MNKSSVFKPSDDAKTLAALIEAVSPNITPLGLTRAIRPFAVMLPNIAVGGPNAVRAFGVADVSVDSGAYAGFELFFDLPVDPVKLFKLPLDPLRPGKSFIRP